VQILRRRVLAGSGPSIGFLVSMPALEVRTYSVFAVNLAWIIITSLTITTMIMDIMAIKSTKSIRKNVMLIKNAATVYGFGITTHTAFKITAIAINERSTFIDVFIRASQPRYGRMAGAVARIYLPVNL
jgi:hypothetical protein